MQSNAQTNLAMQSTISALEREMREWLDRGRQIQELLHRSRLPLPPLAPPNGPQPAVPTAQSQVSITNRTLNPTVPNASVTPGNNANISGGPDAAAETGDDMPLPPERVFPTLDEARQFVATWTRQHGYDMVLNASSNEIKYARCWRAGQPKNTWKLTEATRRRQTQSAKTGCPVYVRYKLTEIGEWMILHPQKLEAHIHNHSRIVGPPSANQRRAERTPEMQRDIAILTGVGVSVAQIDMYLRAKYPGSSQTRKDIANMRMTLTQRAAGVPPTEDGEPWQPSEQAG